MRVECISLIQEDYQMQKLLLTLLMLLGMFSLAFSDTYVKGYTKSNGTQVQGH